MFKNFDVKIEYRYWRVVAHQVFGLHVFYCFFPTNASFQALGSFLSLFIISKTGFISSSFPHSLPDRRWTECCLGSKPYLSLENGAILGLCFWNMEEVPINLPCWGLFDFRTHCFSSKTVKETSVFEVLGPNGWMICLIHFHKKSQCSLVFSQGKSEAGAYR